MNLKTLNKPFIIAEIGSNWKRLPLDPFALAKRHIEDAAMCGVDAVKFQFFTHKELYGMEGKDDYALPEHYLQALKAQCEIFKLHFMCSAFSTQGYRRIDRYVDIHKIASSEANDPDIRATVVSFGKPFIISTAGLGQREIDNISVDLPDRDFIFMECVAKYPAQCHEYSLDHIGKDRTFGLSDHTLNGTLSLGAVARGALVFEKHFDCLRDVPRGRYIPESPDTCVSVDRKQLRKYVNEIHELHGAMNKSIRGYSDEAMHLRWKRRLKIIKPVAIGEQLIQGFNFGSFRSLRDDLNNSPPSKAHVFHEKHSKNALEIGHALNIEDIL